MTLLNIHHLVQLCNMASHQSCLRIGLILHLELCATRISWEWDYIPDVRHPCDE